MTSSAGEIVIIVSSKSRASATVCNHVRGEFEKGRALKGHEVYQVIQFRLQGISISVQSFSPGGSRDACSWSREFVSPHLVHPVQQQTLRPEATGSHFTVTGTIQGGSIGRGNSKITMPALNCRSSFEEHASSDRWTSMGPLETRVLTAEGKRQKEAEMQGAVLDDDEYGDPLDPNLRDSLNTPPGLRQKDDSLCAALNKLAPHFFDILSVDQQTEVARCALYHFFEPGQILCTEDEETSFVFVVLHGEVEVEEPRVSLNEGLSGREAVQKRTKIYNAGMCFHHFPLVMQSRFYGYNARVPEGSMGASILIVSKADYISILRRTIDRDMTETVQMLQSTPFFRSWPTVTLSRLYFWFSREKRGPEEDVVTQGDDADFCFIIKSGRCDVLVELTDANCPSAPGIRRNSRENFDPSESAQSAMPLRRNPAGGASVPAFRRHLRRGERTDDGAEESAAANKLKMMRSQRKQALKFAAAAAFKGNHGDQGLKLRENMRHIVTLRPGSLVGEIALLTDGTQRMATVRTADHVELLMLDKKSFLDLDKTTLNIISENARYNAACTKEPEQRGNDDLHILQSRTSHMTFLSALSSDVHRELCRVMRYRKVSENAILVRKGMPAECLYVLISGSVSIHVTDPNRRRWSSLTAGKNGRISVKQDLTADVFEGVKPNDVKRAGQAIGEDELLEEDAKFGFTAVTSEPVELMEIERSDFDRILKSDKTSERGQLIEFLNNLPMLEGTAIASMHALANAAVKRSFVPDQLCLAYPPDQSLGSASFSSDYIYLVFSGEARILGVIDSDGRRGSKEVPVIDPQGAAYGPATDLPPPHNSRIERHVGSMLKPLAIIGPGECITERMLPGADARWCLRSITQLDLLSIPKRNWQETLRLDAIADLRSIAADKAAFFQQQLNTISQTVKRQNSEAQLRKLSGRRTSSTDASPRASTSEAMSSSNCMAASLRSHRPNTISRSYFTLNTPQSSGSIIAGSSPPVLQQETTPEPPPATAEFSLQSRPKATAAMTVAPPPGTDPFQPWDTPKITSAAPPPATAPPAPFGRPKTSAASFVAAMSNGGVTSPRQKRLLEASNVNASRPRSVLDWVNFYVNKHEPMSQEETLTPRTSTVPSSASSERSAPSQQGSVGSSQQGLSSRPPKLFLHGSRQRDAYAPVVPAAERPVLSPRKDEISPRRVGGSPAGTPRGSLGTSPAGTPRGSPFAYMPPIRLAKSSNIGSRPVSTR